MHFYDMNCELAHKFISLLFTFNKSLFGKYIYSALECTQSEYFISYAIDAFELNIFMYVLVSHSQNNIIINIPTYMYITDLSQFKQHRQERD